MTDQPEPTEKGPETPTEEGATPVPEAPAEAPARHRMHTAGAVVLVCLATTLVATQLAGVLLRDRVEHRVATASEPRPTPDPDTSAAAPIRRPSRMGADVREVVVGTARVPEAPPEPPSPPAPPEPEVAPTLAPPGPDTPPAGTSLQVGIFRSQRYRKEAEDTLDRLGAPRFRIETTRQGVGFRLVVPFATTDARDRAAALLDARGVLSIRAGERLVAYFHMEEEVQSVLGDLSKAGIQAGYGRFEGEVPLWTVLAGPFDGAQTARWETRLHGAGLDTYRRTLP